MSSLILPRRFTQQPQGAVEVDYSKFDVKFALNSAVFHDAAKNTPLAYVGAPSLGTNKDGKGYFLNTTTDYITATNKGIGTAGDFAVMSLFQQNGTVGNGGLMFLLPGTSGNTNQVVSYTLDTGTLRCDYWSGSEVVSVTDSASGAIVNGRFYCVIYSKRAGIGRWYVNGVQSGADKTITGSTSAESSTFQWGGNAGAAPNHHVNLFAILGTHSEAQLREISANPWQIFKRQPQVPYFDVGGGGVDRALTGAAATATAGTVIQSVAETRALTGQNVATQTGTITGAESQDRALTGQAVTVSAGSVSEEIAVALPGQAVTVNAGIVQKETADSKSLAGATVAATAGTVAIAVSDAVDGQAVATQTGTVTRSVAETRALTGQAVATQTGTLGRAIDVAITGQAVTASAGSVSAGADVNKALTGSQVATLPGQFTFAIGQALVGASASSAAGTLTVDTGVVAALTGSSVIASSGATAPSVHVAVVGDVSVVVAGTVSAGADVTASLTGSSVTVTHGGLLGASDRGLVGIDISSNTGSLGRSIVMTLNGSPVLVHAGGMRVPTSTEFARYVAGVRVYQVVPKIRAYTAEVDAVVRT